MGALMLPLAGRSQRPLITTSSDDTQLMVSPPSPPLDGPTDGTGVPGMASPGQGSIHQPVGQGEWAHLVAFKEHLGLFIRSSAGVVGLLGPADGSSPTHPPALRYHSMQAACLP